MSDSPNEAQASESIEAAEKPKRNLTPFIVGAIAIVMVGYFGKSFLEGRHFESTDDAYVTADIVQLSAEVKGTVLKVVPNLNDEVKPGEEVATLDPTDYEAALQQAEASLASAQAQADSAGATVQLTRSQGAADLAGANGGAFAAGGGVGTAVAQVGVLQAQLASAKQSAEVAKIDVTNLDQDIATARDSLQKSRAAIAAAQSAVSAAKSAADGAKSAVKIAQSKRDFAANDYQRTLALYDQGVVSASSRDLVTTNLSGAEAAVAQAQSQASAADAAISQRQSDLESAQLAEKAAESGLAQAIQRRRQGSVKIQSAYSQVASQKSSLEAAKQAVASAQGSLTRAQATVSGAQTLPDKIREKEAQRELALAQVKLAQAAVTTAQINLKRTHILAPVGGHVSKKYALPGTLLTLGSPIASIVPNQGLYIVANFKETQIARMQTGQKVNIDIDALPGHTFQGQVESLSSATGSQFALIPPDNATGNFVKVVQRLPVKIKILSDDQSARIAAGMSVDVKVRVD